MDVSLGNPCVAFMTSDASTLNHSILDSPERVSIWACIAHELAVAIGQGLYAPGIRLPSEHQLAAQFGANRHTIRRALAHLSQSGLVRSTQGRGTYVENLAVDLALGKRTRHRHNLSQAGLRGELHIIGHQKVMANDEQAQALKVPPQSPLLYLQVVGEGAGQALHVSERYFPLPRFDQMAEIVAATGSITAGFAHHGVTDYLRLESRVSARLPSKDVAHHLGQSTHRPVILVKSVNIDEQDRPIEFACAWFAGDRVTLTVQHHDH